MSCASEAASDSRSLKDSSGGVAAKKSSVLYVAISFTTNLLRIKGFVASPLFTSTHLLPMGALPVSRQQSVVSARSQTPQSSMNLISSARACLTKLGGRTAPVISS